MASYILRNVDQGLWAKFRARATAEGHALRWLILTLIDYYVKHGLPKGR
jgi:hypothetical protein